MSVLPRSAEALPGPARSQTFHLPAPVAGGGLFVHSPTPPARSGAQNVPAAARDARPQEKAAMQPAVNAALFRTMEHGIVTQPVEGVPPHPREVSSKLSLVIETDYLVVGSGLAGLYFALRASEHGRVVVATKRAPADANTAFAQGGVAGVLDPGDQLEAHLADTLRTGDGLGHPHVLYLSVLQPPP